MSLKESGKLTTDYQLEIRITQHPFLLLLFSVFMIRKHQFAREMPSASCFPFVISFMFFTITHAVRYGWYNLKSIPLHDDTWTPKAQTNLGMSTCLQVWSKDKNVYIRSLRLWLPEIVDRWQCDGLPLGYDSESFQTVFASFEISYFFFFIIFSYNASGYYAHTLLWNSLYAEKLDSIEPWKNVLITTACHTFVRTKTRVDIYTQTDAHNEHPHNHILISSLN